MDIELAGRGLADVVTVATLIVRALVVPSIVTLGGRWFWWPQFLV